MAVYNIELFSAEVMHSFLAVKPTIVIRNFTFSLEFNFASGITARCLILEEGDVICPFSRWSWNSNTFALVANWTTFRWIYVQFASRCLLAHFSVLIDSAGKHPWYWHYDVEGHTQPSSFCAFHFKPLRLTFAFHVKGGLWNPSTKRTKEMATCTYILRTARFKRENRGHRDKLCDSSSNWICCLILKNRKKND